MEAEYFTGQEVQIRINPQMGQLGPTVSSVKILYTKPNGVDGEWTAAVEVTEIVYTTSASDIDIPGDWQLQAFVVKGGNDLYGKIIWQTFKEPLS